MPESATIPRGRFAPSPSGPLHFGSLIAAVGSFLDIRTRGGQWLLRMEDVDTPRVVPGAAEAILATLDAFGLHWDGPVWYQSQRFEAYEAALACLREHGLVFPCTCSRRELTAVAQRGSAGLIYPGICRQAPTHPERRAALRLRVDDRDIAIDDELQGHFAQNLASEIGDFVLRRADGIYGYQLAVVVDDHAQGITRVVRGSDLLDSTPRQCYLQGLLGFPRPDYLHLPVAVGGNGKKLSKQTQATPVDPRNPRPALLAALDFLGQSPPPALHHATLSGIWQWALQHWQPRTIPALMARQPTPLPESTRMDSPSRGN